MLLKQSEVDMIVHMAYNPEALREWLQQFVSTKTEVAVHVHAFDYSILGDRRPACEIRVGAQKHTLYEGDEFNLTTPLPR